MDNLKDWIGWFRKRVPISDLDEEYLKFVMREYALDEVKKAEQEKVKNNNETNKK